MPVSFFLQSNLKRTHNAYGNCIYQWCLFERAVKGEVLIMDRENNICKYIKCDNSQSDYDTIEKFTKHMIKKFVDV